MSEFDRALPFGAILLGNGRVRFRLWAPAQEEVSLQIEGGPSHPMRREEGGWFAAEISCPVGTAYRYRLGSGELVPDPASRLQAEDVHGPSVVVDSRAYRWRHPEWQGRPWEETVLYELHPGLLGGFKGIEAKLPELKSLGITAIELMPIAEFPGARNWGYDGVLPFAPERGYGTPDELKHLIDAAHAHGMMVFLDVVYNHFGPDGNYLGLYTPQFFRDDIATPWGPSIDFRRAEVRRFFTENALYWLMEYRFDGLRFDAVHAIPEADWLDEMGAEIRATVEPGRHVQLVLEHDGNVAEHLRRDFDAQWNDDIHHVLHHLLTSEASGYYEDYATKPAEKLARALSQGFIYQGEPSSYRDGERRGTPSGGLPPSAFVSFLQNHDQIGNRPFGERLTTLADPEALEAAIALQLLSPHIPLIFMGEEDASAAPFFYFTDHHGELAETVREGRRREFAKFPSFSDPARREEIPDPNAPETLARSLPAPAPEHRQSRRELYRRLLDIRRREIVPSLSTAQSVGATAIGPLAVRAEWRFGDGALLTIATNFDGDAVPIEHLRGDLLFESRKGAAEKASAGELPGRTTLVFMERPS
jgi:malto-oligosyltrehalose trehalohydrolase